jgi:hypothetical protein
VPFDRRERRAQLRAALLHLEWQRRAREHHRLGAEDLPHALGEELIELQQVLGRIRDDEDDTTWPHDPSQLRNRDRAIRDVVQHVHRKRDIERVPREWQPLRIAEHQGCSARSRGRRPQHPLRQIGANHETAV